MLDAPFPWFGGKSRVAPIVWERFGGVVNYCEPFFGSGAVLLGRPGGAAGIETVNDKDSYLCNFWRAIRYAPDETAEYADWPVNESDLHARHVWLRAQAESLAPRLEGDPEYCDPKIAGWWVWGLACWIGSGFCGDGGTGPWQVVDGQLVHLGDAGTGVKRQLVHLGNAGTGVKRQLVHLGDAGTGVKRQRVHLGDAGKGVNKRGKRGIHEWFADLSERLARVRVCVGDWSRICGPTPTAKQGMTGVFLDPPYSADADRDMRLYAEECGTVAHDVRAWCLENGDNPLLRIALCGYAGEGHEELTRAGWTEHAWKASGGYATLGNGNGKANCRRERIWFSPHCLRFGLFE